MNSLLEQGYEDCRRIMQRSGKSYYFATSLFSDQHMKRSTWALYAFFRVPDDIVDEQPDKSSDALRAELAAYTRSWEQGLEQGTHAQPVMAAIVDTFQRYAIPKEYGYSFLASMAADIDKKQYKTYEELEAYMYGSAGVVGYMMALVIGFQNPAALENAKVLGYAMQLTNFLRDIDKDYQELGRIYMPEEELARYGLSYADIANRNWTPEFRRFMQFQVQRAEDLYTVGNACIPILNAQGRFAYKMASVLYSRILNKLAKQDYNPFAGRASTSIGEKLWLLLRTRWVD